MTPQRALIVEQIAAQHRLHGEGGFQRAAHIAARHLHIRRLQVAAQVRREADLRHAR